MSEQTFPYVYSIEGEIMELTQLLIKAVEIAIKDEDVRQDAYVRLMEMDSLPELKEPAKLVRYLRVMGANIQKDKYRSETRRQEIEQEGGSALRISDTDSADPIEYLVAEGVIDRIEELSPLLLDTLTDVYLNGKGISELAKDEGVSTAVIYKRISRARESLMS